MCLYRSLLLYRKLIYIYIQLVYIKKLVLFSLRFSICPLRLSVVFHFLLLIRSFALLLLLLLLLLFSLPFLSDMTRPLPYSLLEYLYNAVDICVCCPSLSVYVNSFKYICFLAFSIQDFSFFFRSLYLLYFFPDKRAKLYIAHLFLFWLG